MSRDERADAAAVALLGGLLVARPDTSTVVLSGRCGECGYPLGSDSCKIECGQP